MIQNNFVLNIFFCRSYYEEKFRWQIQMEAQKSRIDELENAMTQAKVAYNEAMANLSKISEDVSCTKIFSSSFLFKDIFCLFVKTSNFTLKYHITHLSQIKNKPHL